MRVGVLDSSSFGKALEAILPVSVTLVGGVEELSVVDAGASFSTVMQDSVEEAESERSRLSRLILSDMVSSVM